MYKSRRRQKTRPRRRRTTRRRRKTRRGGNKNIFKKYEKRLDAPYFKNKLYFPKEGKEAETYTKSIDRVITGWMREVVERTGAAWWRGGTELYNTSELTTRETADLKNAISSAKSGQAEIRNDKDGNIGVSIGKKSFSDDKLLKNYNAILETLEKEKANNTLKGDLIKSAFLTSTMGVSYKLKLGKNI